MSDAVIMPGPLDDQNSLTTDTICKHCGYNLRGLNRAGNCPGVQHTNRGVAAGLPAPVL